MKKGIIISVSIFILAGLFLCFKLYPTFSDREGQIQNTGNIVNVEAEPDIAIVEETEFTPYYVAQENDGKIGIFEGSAEGLRFLYNVDVSIRSLPLIDREMIERGIVLYSKEELTQFEEDFGS